MDRPGEIQEDEARAVKLSHGLGDLLRKRKQERAHILQSPFREAGGVALEACIRDSLARGIPTMQKTPRRDAATRGRVTFSRVLAGGDTQAEAKTACSSPISINYPEFTQLFPWGRCGLGGKVQWKSHNYAFPHGLARGIGKPALQSSCGLHPSGRRAGGLGSELSLDSASLMCPVTLAVGQCRWQGFGAEHPCLGL